LVKGIWAIIFSIPVIVLVCFYENPQVLVTYTGGICGTFILFLIPVALVTFARRYRKRQILKGELEDGPNFNASPFKSPIWSILIVSFALITLYFVILGIIDGNAGH
jgi:amino acid transporter